MSFIIQNQNACIVTYLDNDYWTILLSLVTMRMNSVQIRMNISDIWSIVIAGPKSIEFETSSRPPISSVKLSSFLLFWACIIKEVCVPGQCLCNRSFVFPFSSYLLFLSLPLSSYLMSTFTLMLMETSLAVLSTGNVYLP